MWQGDGDVKGWKQKDSDEQSVSNMVGEGGVVADVDNRDKAVANHRLGSKGRQDLRYALKSGFIISAPRFKDNIDALLLLSNFDLPPLQVVRPAQVVHLYYGFGDASGKQFGATMSKSYGCARRLSEDGRVGGGIQFQVGLRTTEEEEESSNYKELKNLVDTVEGEVMGGRLQDCEFFLVTDNSTAKSCFYRGNSKSRNLHALLLKLRSLEMTYGMIIHIVHFFGKRMIVQGTDGCLC